MMTITDKINLFLEEKKIKFNFKKAGGGTEVVDAAVKRKATKEDGYGRGFYLIAYKDPLTGNAQEKFIHKSLFRDKKRNLIK